MCFKVSIFEFHGLLLIITERIALLTVFFVVVVFKSRHHTIKMFTWKTKSSALLMDKPKEDRILTALLTFDSP